MSTFSWMEGGGLWWSKRPRLTFWLPALTLNCMSSPTVVVARSGPAGLPFSSPNLYTEINRLQSVTTTHVTSIRSANSLGPMFPLGDRVAHFPHLSPPLDLSRDLDLFAIFVVSPFGDGDGAIRVVDLGRSGESDAWCARMRFMRSAGVGVRVESGLGSLLTLLGTIIVGPVGSSRLTGGKTSSRLIVSMSACLSPSLVSTPRSPFEFQTHSIAIGIVVIRSGFCVKRLEGVRR